MSIGIRFVSSYRPTKTIDNIVQASRWDKEEDFISNKIGNLQLTRKSDSEDTTDLAKAAVEKLFQQTNILRSEVQCMF